MKIIKYGSKIATSRVQANMDARICPLCGETRARDKSVSGETKFDFSYGIEMTGHEKVSLEGMEKQFCVDNYVCHTCGTIWQSEPWSTEDCTDVPVFRHFKYSDKFREEMIAERKRRANSSGPGVYSMTRDAASTISRHFTDIEDEKILKHLDKILANDPNLRSNIGEKLSDEESKSDDSAVK